MYPDPQSTIDRLPTAERLLAWLLTAVSAMLVAFAGLLLVRRLAGAFERPLGGPGLLGMTAALIAGAAAWRLACRAVRYHGGRERFWPGHLVPTVCLLFIAGALSLPGSPGWALAILWSTIVVVETGWWVPLLWPRRRNAAPGPALRPASSSGLSARRETRSTDERCDNPELAADVIQQITRTAAPDGSEALQGVLRADFAAGERLRHVHVAFCPPMAATPHLEAALIDGPRATIKVAQRESFGARLEVRLNAIPDRPEQITIQLHAHCRSAATDGDD